ncbi:hypothetical protein DHEL01_v205167 [Diaporthe helianthi]|uniref:Uncharacterized protein n=1 Tax=Diaporthe helianthi TaxID=158607 RepID=A0A2P5I1P0_DIAHE|nr:hypothetical protein DHEL01_v205167 [Diaporthe helianthi]
MQLRKGTSVVSVAWKSSSQDGRARFGGQCRKACGVVMSIARDVKCGPLAGLWEADLLVWVIGAWGLSLASLGGGRGAVKEAAADEDSSTTVLAPGTREVVDAGG